jgi:tetratricopeptide (TPR) repeat protein
MRGTGKNIFLLLMLLLLPELCCVSQNVDSLKKELKSATHDTVRVLICEQLSQVSDLKVIREYSWMEYEICRNGLIKGGPLKDFYSNYFALAHNNIGFYFENAGQIDSALVHFQEYLKISEREGRQEHVGTALNNLGVIMSDLGDMQKAAEYYKKSYAIGLKTNDRQTISVGLIKLAQIFNRQGQNDSALAYYKKALAAVEGSKEKKIAAQALMSIGQQYLRMNKTAEAIEYSKKGMKIWHELKDEIDEGAALSMIGTIYYRQGDLQKALDHFTEALKISERINDKDGIATACNNLGSVYKTLGFGEKALEFMNRSLQKEKEIRDWLGMMNTYYNMGAIYYKLGDPLIKEDRAASYNSAAAKAVDNFNKGLALAQKISNPQGIAAGYKHLGNIFTLKIPGVIDRTDNTKAMEYYDKSLAYSEKLNDKQGIASVLCNSSKVLFEMGDIAEAKKRAEESYSIASALGYPEMIKNICEALTHMYDHTGDYKKAYEMHVIYKQMSDSLSSEAGRKASIQRSFQYEYDKKAAADSVRTVEERRSHQAKMKEEGTKRFALYGGLILIGIFSIFMFNRFRISQKQKAIIEKQKLEVDEAYDRLHEKNKEVLDSIRYAKRIQDSFLPSERFIGRIFRKNNEG